MSETALDQKHDSPSRSIAIVIRVQLLGTDALNAKLFTCGAFGDATITLETGPVEQTRCSQCVTVEPTETYFGLSLSAFLAGDNRTWPLSILLHCYIPVFLEQDEKRPPLES